MVDVFGSDDPGKLRVPIVEERIAVDRREVETDRIRVRTVVDTHETLVEEMIRVGRLDVARVAVEREVAEPPAPRQEGDTLVIPIVEERVVVEKRLFVVEEVRVTASTREEAVSLPVALRRTRAVIERADTEQSEEGRD